MVKMMTLNITLLAEKISDPHYQQMIREYAMPLSSTEIALLNEIMAKFHFNAAQSQALGQAVLQQSRFDPNAGHLNDEFYDEDDDSTAICAHCLNPPIPPLRDYLMWREKQTHLSHSFSSTTP